LVPMEWRQIGPAVTVVVFKVENGSGIEWAIPMEFEQCAVQVVRAASGNG